MNKITIANDHNNNHNTLPPDLVCFSHLRWNFVYQRPQHLLSRFAKQFRLFFIEEPVFTPIPDNLQVTKDSNDVWIVVPQMQENRSDESVTIRQKRLLQE